MHSFKFPIYLTLIFPLLLAACNTMSTSSDTSVEVEKAEAPRYAATTSSDDSAIDPIVSTMPTARPAPQPLWTRTA